MRTKKTILCFILIILVPGAKWAANTDPPDTDAAGKCMTCHKEKSPGLYCQWFNLAHGVHNVTCIDCHGKYLELYNWLYYLKNNSKEVLIWQVII